MSSPAQISIVQDVAGSDHLTNLPIEILIHLSTYLATVDYGSLRLTCKDIERKLFDDFADEFFTIRQVGLFPESLDSLVDISCHPELSRFVKKVIIGFDNFNGISASSGGDSAGLDARRFQLRASYTMETSSWTDYFAAAIPKLKSLETVEIRDFMAHKRRPREGTPWRSYFVPTLERQYNAEIQPGALPVKCMLANLLRTFSKANARLQELNYITRLCPSATDMMELFVPTSISPNISAFLGHLQTLMLCLRLPSRFNNLEQVAFQPMLEACASLQHLRLNFVYHMHGHSQGDRLVTLTSPVLESLAVLKGRSLRKLELGFAHISNHTLEVVIAALGDSLEHIGLRGVTLCSKDAFEIMLRLLESVETLKGFSVASRACSDTLWKSSVDAELKSAERTYEDEDRVLCISPVQYTIDITQACKQDVLNEIRGRLLNKDDIHERFNVKPGDLVRYYKAHDKHKKCLAPPPNKQTARMGTVPNQPTAQQ